MQDIKEARAMFKRMFYSAIGHRPELYAEPVHIQMLEQGVEWTIGSNDRTYRTKK